MVSMCRGEGDSSSLLNANVLICSGSRSTVIELYFDRNGYTCI